MTAPVRQRPALALGLALAVGGCGHSARTGPPASLPTGEPRNACEQRAWLETAPARFRPGGTSAIFEGIGVFRANESELQDLDAVFPRMKEAELQAGHQERVARTDAATRRALIWGAIAGGGMVAGLGTAALIEDRNHAPPTCSASPVWRSESSG